MPCGILKHIITHLAPQVLGPSSVKKPGLTLVLQALESRLPPEAFERLVMRRVRKLYPQKKLRTSYGLIRLHAKLKNSCYSLHELADTAKQKQKTEQHIDFKALRIITSEKPVQRPLLLVRTSQIRNWGKSSRTTSHVDARPASSTAALWRPRFDVGE